MERLKNSLLSDFVNRCFENLKARLFLNLTKKMKLVSYIISSNDFFFFFFCNFGKPGLLKCKRKTYDLPCILFTNDKTQSHIQIY